MAWDITEALSYYKNQGAPNDQGVLIQLLREIQQESGGGIPRHCLPKVAESLQTKESLLLAIIRRIPSLRLSDTHCLEICAGPNCSKRASLITAAEKMLGKDSRVTIKEAPCMRMCGKGPNIRWDGTVYHSADEALLRKLLAE